MKKTATILLVLLVGLLAAACKSSGPVVLTPGSDQGQQGITGQVTIGVGCLQGVHSPTPCPGQPFQADITIIDASGLELTTFQTDEQGNFRVALDPGTYRVRPEPVGIAVAEELLVTVQQGVFNPLHVEYDSGSR